MYELTANKEATVVFLKYAGTSHKLPLGTWRWAIAVNIVHLSGEELPIERWLVPEKFHRGCREIIEERFQQGCRRVLEEE